MPVPITHPFVALAESGSASIDLSKARRLKEVAFLAEEPSARWVSTVLKTITPSHQNLKWISLRIPLVASSPIPTLLVVLILSTSGIYVGDHP